MFYYDDVEVCNPIGSKRKIHKQGSVFMLVYKNIIIHVLQRITYIKLGCFYFTLGNLHPKYRSKFRSIHLAALCKREYITKYKMNAILSPIINDLKCLVRHLSISSLPFSCTCTSHRNKEFSFHSLKNLYMGHWHSHQQTTLLTALWEGSKKAPPHIDTADSVWPLTKKRHVR